MAGACDSDALCACVGFNGVNYRAITSLIVDQSVIHACRPYSRGYSRPQSLAMERVLTTSATAGRYSVAVCRMTRNYTSVSHYGLDRTPQEKYDRSLTSSVTQMFHELGWKSLAGTPA